MTKKRGPGRPCRSCGKVFDTVPERRMLCLACFQRGGKIPGYGKLA